MCRGWSQVVGLDSDGVGTSQSSGAAFVIPGPPFTPKIIRSVGEIFAGALPESLEFRAKSDGSSLIEARQHALAKLRQNCPAQDSPGLALTF